MKNASPCTIKFYHSVEQAQADGVTLERHPVHPSDWLEVEMVTEESECMLEEAMIVCPEDSITIVQSDDDFVVWLVFPTTADEGGK